MNRYQHDIPDRTFMKVLLKHTGIALALLVPLAAYSTFAKAEVGSEVVNNNVDINASEASTSVSVPTAVDKVDLNKYAGQWYEIARLPMRFQQD